MRAGVFAAAVLCVFGILAYTIWLESAVIAEAYHLRRLRGEEAEIRNSIRILEADIARKTKLGELTKAAERLGIKDFERHTASIVHVDDVIETTIQETN